MPIHYVWLGDFNCHHPLWDKPQNAHLFTKHNLDLTQPLLNLLSRYNMKMALPPFAPMLHTHSTGNHMRVNNFFCSEDLLDMVTRCDTNEATCPIKTDYYPIVTTLDVYTPKVNHPPRFDFHNMKWPDFLPTLELNLDNLPQPAPINNINTFNHKLTALNTTIWDAINTHLEVSKPSPYSKRWWSTALAQNKKATTKLAWKAKLFHDHPNHPIHKAYCLQCNKYSDHM